MCFRSIYDMRCTLKVKLIRHLLVLIVHTTTLEGCMLLFVCWQIKQPVYLHLQKKFIREYSLTYHVCIMLWQYHWVPKKTLDASTGCPLRIHQPKISGYLFFKGYKKPAFAKHTNTSKLSARGWDDINDLDRKINNLYR